MQCTYDSPENEDDISADHNGGGRLTFPGGRRAVTLCLRVLLLIALCSAGGISEASGGPDEMLVTVAESSNFEATCTSQECDTFVAMCDQRAAHLSRIAFGVTADDRELVAAIVASPAADLSTRDDRLRILVIGNIHSGECAGKEALLAMLRDLSSSPDHPWLRGAVLIVVPNYNADANDRMATTNRPGQAGPVRGMGRRENSQGLDLNRDFMKVESPEAASLIRLMTDFDPHLFIDCHTTNGSRHRYALTYDIPHNPSTSPKIRDYLRNDMMPRVTQELEDRGTATFYYGNFNEEHTTWTTYGHEPRYSTEYSGLRGRLGILAEAYSYISFADRISATRAFVTSCISDALAQAHTIRMLTERVDRELIRQQRKGASGIPIAIDSTLVAFPDRVLIRGYRQDIPFDYECEFLGAFQAVKEVTLPEAYLVPERLARVLQLLRRHGIQMEQLTEDRTLNVETDRIATVETSQRSFQGHRMQRVTALRRTSRETVARGTWVVTTRQPLARVAAYLLEAESNDGIVVWNIVDDAPQEGVDYPVRRLSERLARQ